MPAAEKLAVLHPGAAHRTLAERAFTTLQDAIVTGVLAPDPVGLVENIPHRGARVTELSIDDLRDAAERFSDADAALAARRLEHERILQACVDHHPAAAACELHDHLARTAIAAQMGSQELFEPLATEAMGASR